MLNAFDTNPILGRIINGTYLNLIKKKPELWGKMYDNPEVMEKIKKTRERLHRFNLPKMKRLFKRFNPGIVYCTQAFPCGMIAAYKKEYKIDIPLVGVLTDHAPHLYWLFDEVDLYIVPSVAVGDMMVQKGVPPHKIRVYGIPIDPKFAVNYERRLLRSEMGFNDKPVVLIMGGSQGLGAIEEVVNTLLKKSEDKYQIVAITGKNKKVYKNLLKIKNISGRETVRVFSYVDNIDKMMEASDIIITKAGGITTSEALAKKLPIIVVDPIPGQERFNTDFLVKEGAGVEIKDLSKICEVLDDIFGNNRTKLDKMRQSSAKLSNPDSAFRIAKLAVTGIE